MGECEVCHKRHSRYTCPRCGVCYCSESCYKDHSNQCAAGFRAAQEDSILGLAQRPDEQSIRKLSNRLKKSSLDESEIDFPEERKAYLLERLLDGSLSTEHLTPEELKTFEHAVNNVDSRLLEADDWKPWWIPADESTGVVIERTDAAPVVVHICCTAGRQTSLSVFQDIVCVALSYCVLSRFVRGDFGCLALELGLAADKASVSFCAAMRQLTTALERPAEIPPVSLVLVAAEDWSNHLLNSKEPPLLCQFSESTVTVGIKDAACLLRSQESLVRLLREVQSHLRKAKREVTSSGPPHLSKKIEFWISFVTYHTSEFTFRGGVSPGESVSLFDASQALWEMVKGDS